MNKLSELLEAKGMCKIETVSGTIGWKDNKATIEDAIKCLEATDEEMDDYLTVVRLFYPGIYSGIIKGEDHLTDSYYRYFVYGIATDVFKLVLHGRSSN